MATPIRRYIQLVLDKISAQRAEADAKKTLGNIEGGFDKLRAMATRLAAGVAAVFGARAILNFAKSAVEAGAKVEQVWNDLRGTVENTGASFDKMEGQIRATAAAFQDATIHNGEDFAEGLARMITLTGDVDGSLKNMGLAANVASQFFKGELAPAIELVAKVSQGNVTMLQKMGIAADSAAEGLDILSKRSMGAAERQTRTFSGWLRQLTNDWGDFKEELGDALIASNAQNSAMSVLRETVQSMTRWVIDNKDALREWVADGITLAIRGVTALTDAVKTFLQFRGQMAMTAGSKPMMLSDNLLGLGAQLKSLERQREQAVKEQADILAKMEKLESTGALIKQTLLGPVGSAMAIKSMVELNGELQSANDQLELIDANAERVKQALKDLAKPKDKPIDLFGGSPKVIREKAKDGTGEKEKENKEELDPIIASMQKFSSAMQVAHGMFQLLGSDFDLVGAESNALKSHIEDLLAAGVSPMDQMVVDLSDRLEELTVKEDKVGQVTQALTDQMALITTQASAFGEGFDSLGAKASALETAITSLATMGFSASDPVMAKYIEQLRQVREAMKMSEEQAKMYGIAVSNVQSLIVGAVGGSLKEVAKAKAKENLLLAAEEAAHGVVSLLNPFTAAKAGGHFAMAAKFTAIAGAWGALGSAIGGGAGSGSAALGGAQGASGPASQASEKAQQEVNIFLTGPGFHAMNPEVQKVVYGAQQQIRERYGNNARVNVLTSGGR